MAIRKRGCIIVINAAVFLMMKAIVQTIIVADRVRSIYLSIFYVLIGYFTKFALAVTDRKNARVLNVYVTY